jgi:predicted PurR-regulated permease PerM
VFQFPYALLIAVLIAVTALIPMVGAYIALVVGAFLILLINPWQALAFIILFLVIQQLENNLIYPRVVGSSIGLPALWVLAAVVIGGGLFGVMGMILFIPLMSVSYSLVRQWVTIRESARLTAQKNAASAEAGHGTKDQETVH